jgi:membrane protein YqaA with SNARE-associated domain
VDSSASESAAKAPAVPVERWVVVFGALAIVAPLLGAAFFPYLAVHHPLVLIALSPWPRHLLAVAHATSLPAFMSVALLSRLFTSTVAYAIGRKHGVVGLHWIGARSGQASEVLNTIVSVFDRAAPLVLLVAPGPLFCALAGVRAMSLWLAAPAIVIGQTGWLYATYLLGDVLSPWLTPMLAFMRAHVLETTVACVLVVLAYQLIKRLRPARKP